MLNKVKIKKIAIGAFVISSVGFLSTIPIAQVTKHKNSNSIKTSGNGLLVSPAPLTKIQFPSTLNFLPTVFNGNDIPQNPTTMPPFQKIGVYISKNPITNVPNSSNIKFVDSLIDLSKWYLVHSGGYKDPGPFPINEKNFLTNNMEVANEFFKINGIPNTTLSDLKSAEMLLTYPALNGTVLNLNLATNPSVIPSLTAFQYKVATLDTNSIPKTGGVEFKYGYQGKKYSIFINNNNGELNDATKTIQDLVRTGIVMIRENQRKYTSTPPNNSPIDISSKNLHITRDSTGKINLYIDVKPGGTSTFSIGGISSTWESKIKAGFLDNSAMPNHIEKTISSPTAWSIIDNNETKTNILDAYSNQSDWKRNTNGQINGAINVETYTMKLYMRPGQSIDLPVIYKGNKNLGTDGSTDGSGVKPKLSLSVDLNGKVISNTKTIRIPTSAYDKFVNPIEIKYRIELDSNGNKWTEINLVTDKNVVIGGMTPISTPNNIVRETFHFKDFGMDGTPIRFEKPLNFTKAFKTISIGYGKVVNVKKEIPKLLGDIYLKAIGKSISPPLNSILPIANFRQSLFAPIFNGKSLDNTKRKNLIVENNSKPSKGLGLVDNNFGYLIEQLNLYGNNLNSIIKKITGTPLFDSEDVDYFLKTNETSSTTFANERFLYKNENKQIFNELAKAFDVYINGLNNSSLSPQDKNIPNIKKVIKGDRDSLVRFSMPRFISIIKNKIKLIEADFNKKIFDYKYNMIMHLYDSSLGTYKGFDDTSIKTKKIMIGGFEQEMKVFNGKISGGPTNFASFKKQISSFVNVLKGSQNARKSLTKQEFKDFNSISGILTKPKVDMLASKDEVVKSMGYVFKILDNLSGKPNNDLVNILNIQTFEGDNSKRTKLLVDTINADVEKVKNDKKVVVISSGFKATISQTSIDVGSYNLHKIFDSFIKQPGLSIDAKKEIQKYRDLDFVLDPNKMADIGVKINEFNIATFFKKLNGANISEIATEILKLDPLKQLPQNLPQRSKFTNIVKSIAEKPGIIFGIVGGLVMLIGMLLFSIGFRNKIKSKKIIIIISVVTIALGLFIALMTIIFPPIGVMSLLAL